MKRHVERHGPTMLRRVAAAAVLCAALVGAGAISSAAPFSTHLAGTLAASRRAVGSLIPVESPMPMLTLRQMILGAAPAQSSTATSAPSVATDSSIYPYNTQVRVAGGGFFAQESVQLVFTEVLWPDFRREHLEYDLSRERYVRKIFLLVGIRSERILHRNRIVICIG